MRAKPLELTQVYLCYPLMYYPKCCVWWKI
jgi:hypothetical protein